MCGIAGFIDSTFTSSENEIMIKEMLQSIIHRGSDNSDFKIINNTYLGHNRLSIIDLTKESNQPYIYKNFHLVFNGEIYNYIEIREDLIQLGYQFETNSDTEVLIKSFEAFGEKCVDKFMGMWAFVIYDDKKQTLFCSRDRFGIKPFYYILNETGFYFSSEIKSLKKIKNFKAEINLNHVQRYLSIGLVAYKDQTFYTEIKSLPAATNLTYINKKTNINEYWSLKKTPEKIDFNSAKDQFSKLLKQSVDQHLRRDVKIGACLSGGIDSSSLVSMISKEYNFQLDTYNIYYDGKNETDERKWVYDVIEKYKNLTPHFITPTENDIKSSLKKIIYHQDGPIPSSGIMSQYFLFQEVKKDDIKVIIDGQGADEYLAGYFNFYPYFFAELLKKMNFWNYFKETRIYSKSQNFSIKKNILLHITSLKNIFVSYEKSKQIELNRKPNILKNNKPIQFNFDKSIYKRSNADELVIQHLNLLILPNLLHYEDRNSMAFTIESRLPFLDHRLVEYVYNLPFSFKIKNGFTKYILRESMKNITPNSVLERTDKKGFTTPGEVKWLNGALKELIKENNLRYLEESCNLEKVYKLIREFKKEDYSNSALVWRIVMLNEWLKQEYESGLVITYSK